MLRFASPTRLRLALSAALASLTLVSAPAFAGDTTGTIAVTLNVTNACVVNGATTVQTNSGPMGTIAFPDQPGLFGDVNGELVGSLGQLRIQCSPGVSPALTIGSGANDANGRRYMAANGRQIAYRLFSDAQRNTEIGIGQQIGLGQVTSSPVNVPIYARVNSGGALLAAGAYADTVQVTLSW